MLLGLLRRKREIHEMISDVASMREHLDWAHDYAIPLRITGEVSSNRFEAVLSGIDHSQRTGYLRIRVSNRAEAKAVLKEEGELHVTYDSNRGIHYEFQTRLLDEIGEEGMEFKLSYPAFVDSHQDYQTARCKSSSDEPIQVDVEKEQGVVIDIGLNGLRFTSNRVFEAGTQVKRLLVDLPRYGRVEGQGVVKYTHPATDYPLWRYLCGVEFTDMKPKDHKKLNRYVSRMVQIGRV
jgi:c-di-GMP-binding flagellar brake protein YcgR